MRMGSKSLLFGAHQFLIHPLFLSVAWIKLYGVGRQVDPYVSTGLYDPRLWLAFLAHDLGYWQCRMIDDAEGEKHVEFAHNLFVRLGQPDFAKFCLYHSRFRARQDNQPYSKLCVADKLAVTLEPYWLYMPRVMLSGEIKEYMFESSSLNPNSKYKGEPRTKAQEQAFGEETTPRQWWLSMTEYLRAWAYTHRSGIQDRWTPHRDREGQYD